MDVTNRNQLSPHFQARVRLKDFSSLYNTNVKETTKLDKMFNENCLVKTCQQVSWKTKTNIINKHFNNPQNSFAKKAQRFFYVIALGARKLGDKIFFLSNRKSINHLNKTFTELKPESKEYIDELAKIGNSMGKKHININIEDNPLKNISKSKNATIFVLNHPNFNKDKFNYVILNSLLNKMYAEQGRQLDCPRPKIIVSKNMLKVLGNKVGNIYKQLGLSEVDASLKNRDTKTNSNTMHSLLKEFAENKSNIFIFPEGNNSSFVNKPLEEKIQSGIAGLVRTATQTKDSVRVVPVGIHYTKDKNSMGNLFIGKPMYFKKSGNDIVFTEGTEKKKISHVNIKNSIPAILKEICENMKYGIEKASNM